MCFYNRPIKYYLQKHFKNVVINSEIIKGKTHIVNLLRNFHGNAYTLSFFLYVLINYK